MKNEVAVIENINAVEVFKAGGAAQILNAIREEVKGEVPDLSTKKGRDRIASLAHKVARSKTALDKAGKELADQLNAQLKPINAERKTIRDELDKLKDDIRKPLTDWENAEKERVDAHRLAIAGMVSMANPIDDNGDHLHAYQLQSFLNDLESVDLGDHWEEFAKEAAETKDKCLAELKCHIEKREAYEAEQAELERLRVEAAEREQKEREERIAREAEAKAKEEAEAAAKAEQERVMREKAQAEERERQAKIAAEQAEQRRIAQEEQAKRDAEAAEKKRLADIEAAKQAEIARQEQERQRIAQEQAAREADIEHRKAINNNAVNAMMQVGITRDQAVTLVKMMAKGHVPNVTINY